ncbi:MAG: SDR family NAD(P)-dependent oxidoreductase [Thermodesulfobacteriota bacterium]
MDDRHSLSDSGRQVAIVTGGASGIGKALCEELAKRGCSVILADLQIELARETASDICAAGGMAEAHELDVTRFAMVDELVRQTIQRQGRIDYMFNNAGIGIGGEVRHFSIEDWDRIIDVNFRGVTNGIQAVYCRMIEQGFGHIVNTASMAGLGPTPLTVAYSATKHAVVGLSKSLRAEAAAYGVRVSVLCPGVIRTPILSGGKYGKFLIRDHGKKLTPMLERLRPMPPGVFAPKVMDALIRNQAIIIVPAWWKLIWYLHRLFPLLGIYLTEKAVQDARKELDLGGHTHESG